MIPRARWLLPLVLIALGPLLFRMAGSPVGSFGMFTRFVQYRLSIQATRADGEATAFSLSRLAPHLGRDARRIILPAERGFVGETTVELLATGLPDLGRLACRIDPTARAFDLVLERRRLDQVPLPEARARVKCDEPRR